MIEWGNDNPDVVAGVVSVLLGLCALAVTVIAVRRRAHSTRHDERWRDPRWSDKPMLHIEMPSDHEFTKKQQREFTRLMDESPAVEGPASWYRGLHYERLQPGERIITATPEKPGPDMSGASLNKLRVGTGWKASAKAAESGGALLHPDFVAELQKKVAALAGHQEPTESPETERRTGAIPQPRPSPLYPPSVGGLVVVDVYGERVMIVERVDYAPGAAHQTHVTVQGVLTGKHGRGVHSMDAEIAPPTRPPQRPTSRTDSTGPG